MREPVDVPAAAATVAAATVAAAPRRWLALAILLAAGFMDLLDTTIVNVAIPSIRGDLRASYAGVQWIVAGYLLALAVGLITGGRLGDIHGRKRVFVIGVVGFGLASLASGLAPTPTVLVLTRVLQGLCAALMVPQILSMIQVSFTREEQGKALVLYSSVAGVAVMSGPLLAGVLLDVFGFTWRSIFLINVPVSVVAAIAAIAIVPESRAPAGRRLDLGGVGLVSLALLAFVFGAIEGRALGWPVWLIATTAAAVPLMGAFVAYERRQERRGVTPLISPGLFGERAFSAGLVVFLVFFSGIVGFFLAFTIFLQLGLGWTPLESALTTFPSSIGLIVASQVGARLVPRLGRQILAIGAMVMAAGIAGLVLTIHHFGPSLTAWEVRPVIFVFGLGMGLILPSLADVVLAGVHERNAGAASGVLNTAVQVGNAVGVAIIGAILFSSLGSHSRSSAAVATPQVARAVAAAGLPAAAGRRVVSDFAACFVARSHEEDPAAVPGPCRTQAKAALGPSVDAALAAASKRGRVDNFVAAIQRALGYAVAVFLATFGLVFLLPRPARAPGRGERGPARGAPDVDAAGNLSV